MLKNIFKGSVAKLWQQPAIDPAKVRALATGAALAVSVDTSPAVLVSIYDYAHRYRDRPRRTA
jgi:hypothetical protein